MSTFLRSIQKKLHNPNASIVSEGIVGDLSGFIDSGSYLINSVVSGDIYGGFPDNKITILAGPEATGKSFIILNTLANFLRTFPKGHAIFFESESAQRKDLMESLGVDISRVLFVPLKTVQEFRTNCLQVLTEYALLSPETRKEERLFLCMDSLGNLSTTKEIEDSSSGKETQDMTRARLIKSTFRTITLQLGILSVPLLCTNHTYQSQGLFSTTEMSGGCVFPDTEVVMFDGTSKQIKDIKKGDYVFTGAGSGKVSRVWTPKTLERPNPECVKVILTTGEEICCSLEHRFWVGGDWEQIKYLSSGSILSALEFGKSPSHRAIEHIIPLGKNPVYDLEIENKGYYITKQGSLFSHNSGPKFNASTILYLTKKKEKEGTVVIGNIVHVAVNKSRFTREGSRIDAYINFSTGLDRYYGLLEVGIEAGLIKEQGRRFMFPTGELVFKKELKRDPIQYFNHALLEQLNQYLSSRFKYGECVSEFEGNDDDDDQDDDLL